jgi:hypothetical protein
VENLLIYPVIVGFLALLLGGFLFQGRPLRGDALDQFESLAKTIKGTVDPGSWFRRPKIRFEASGGPAEITWMRTGRDELSQLWLLVTVSGLPAGDLKMWSKARPWRLRWGPPWGCPPVPIGDPELVIRSRPASIAERLFAPERRAEASALVRTLVGDDELTIRGGVLRTRFSVGGIRTSGLSDLASRVRKLTALLQEAAR